MAVQRLEEATVDSALRSCVHAAADRLGGVVVVSSPRWHAFVNQLALGDRARLDATTTLVVGPLADVLRHARNDHAEFAFVMPVAQIAKPWQRGRNWRDDATLELWRAGWSPQDLDRVLVPGADATVEFVIGNARRTPQAGD